MMKYLFTFGLSLLLSLQITAQSQFENPGFEEWESIQYGSIPEPVDWSSVRTALPDELAEVAPSIWDRSEDAHSGNYSVYLISKEAFGIVATGVITNVRVHADLDPNKGFVDTDQADSRWNTPFTQRPDSVAVWYKAKPMSGDFPNIKVLLHTGYASLPQDDSSTWIAIVNTNLSTTEVNTWTRFSAPFQYFSDETPEYILAVFTAGNGVDAIAGSEAWFDDLELIYNNTAIKEPLIEQLSVTFSNGYLNIYLDQTKREQASLIITDISGRRLLVDEFQTGENHHVHLQNESGIYLVTVQTGHFSLTKKVVVQ